MFIYDIYEGEINMAENDGKFEEWMYDFAWKGYNEALEHIKIVDNKAMNIINFSSLLIPLIAGVYFYILNRTDSYEVQLFLIISIVSMITSVSLAFVVLMPKDHGIISVREHFRKIDEADNDDILHILGRTSKDILKWQEALITTGKKKSKYFKMSSWVFIFALILVLMSAIWSSILILL